MNRRADTLPSLSAKHRVWLPAVLDISCCIKLDFVAGKKNKGNLYARCSEFRGTKKCHRDGQAAL